MSSILYRVEDSVGVIELNRPEVYNSFNRPMSLEMQEALDQCSADSNVRVVYVTGQGKGFCAGQDLGEATAPDGPELASIVRDHYNPIIRKMRELEKPVICAVNGVAAGAGANIAFAGDIVVANESASFIQAFSKIGLIPDSGGTFFLPRMIGFQKASALMMLADKVSAAEAEQMGMIYKWFSDETFTEESWKIATFMAKMPTRGFALTKQALNRSMTNDLNQQLDVELELQTEAGTTHDFREGVAAFLEKRRPEFKGE